MKILFLILISLVSFGSESSQSKGYRILFLGDSLTEGYNLEKSKNYPSQLMELLRNKKINPVVVNGGIAGATSASGKSLLKWHLKNKPDIAVVALGANDALRGISVQLTSKNIEFIIKELKSNKVKVLLAGMKAPPNYGKEYEKKFENIFSSLSEKLKVPLMPFLLQDVAGVKKLNLPDGIHPNEEGYKIVANNMLPYLLKVMKK